MQVNFGKTRLKRCDLLFLFQLNFTTDFYFPWNYCNSSLTSWQKLKVIIRYNHKFVSHEKPLKTLNFALLVTIKNNFEGFRNISLSYTYNFFSYRLDYSALLNMIVISIWSLSMAYSESHQTSKNYYLLFFRSTWLIRVKSVRIRSYSGSHFPAFGLKTERYYGEILPISPYSVRMLENADQNNSEYGHFLCSAVFC